MLGLAFCSVWIEAHDKLSVPVQFLAPPPRPTMMPRTAPAVTEPPAVTPAARMPQYQLQRSHLGTITDPQSPSIRFLLATPGKPLLIETHVTIDGHPFAQSREQRVEKIVAFIADPTSFRQAEARSTAAQVSRPVTPPAPPAVQSLPAPASVPDTAAEPVVPATPRYVPPRTIYERIERHIAATGTRPTAQEIRWMLTHWTDGPVLLFLNDNFQRFRSSQQPLFRVLDIDHDNIISPTELAAAVKSVESCDLDRNEVVESTEIAKVASDPRLLSKVHAPSPSLVLRLDSPAALSGLMARLNGCYTGESSREALATIDADRNGQLNVAEQQQLLTRPADLVLQVTFNSQKADESRLSVVTATESLRSALDTAISSDGTIVLALGNSTLELSAVQGPAGDQVSIGAVNDGYAMLPELDANGDGRLTIRERRTLHERLKSFDRSGDGAIALDELGATYRLCIGLGPHVHQTLSTLRQTNRPETPANAAPEWFVEMDKNKDHDLSRTEFPGTDEQFQQLDSDTDELISSSEASRANF